MGLSEYAASLVVRSSRYAAGQGLFTTRPHKAGSLLLAVPAGRCTSPELRALQAASIGNDHYQLPQAMSSEDALRGVVLEEQHREHRAAFAALLSDPRQWRSISAPRRLVTGEAELRSSELFFSLAKLTRAPSSEAFSIHGLINHSCEANVQRTFATDPSERPWLLLRAAEDLQADEELLDSYFFPLVPLEERHRSLANLGPKATFKCRCARCLAEEPTECHEANRWSELKSVLIQLALLRGKGLQGAEVAGIKDPFLRQSSAGKLLRQLQQVLTDRLSSPSWVVGAAILADLQVAVEGNFAAAEDILSLAMGSLKPGSAAKLELAAVRCSYAATRLAVHGDESSGACAELKKCLELCGSSLSEHLPPLQRYLDQLAVQKRCSHCRCSTSLNARLPSLYTCHYYITLL